MSTSTALHTDRYELTMLDAALSSGVAHRRAVFETFSRRLPAGRRFGVLAGTGRLMEALAAFHFGAAELDWLADEQVVSDTALEWLADFGFSGDIDGYREGELWFPGSPVLTVESTFGEAVLLETLVLSVLNHDSAVAAAASRMALAAGSRPLFEMGGRRTDDEAAVAAARAAYLAGFAASSNLEAGRRYGIPTAGTSAHAFTLAHADERSAFDTQLRALGSGTTLLVDTFDTETGIRNAVAAARAAGADGPGAIRIDSGDLALEARRARALLDDLGARQTRIVVSGDLDEHRIAALAEAPADTYGVGTAVVTGSHHPTADFVYKLVAIADSPEAGAPLRAVAKSSAGKATVGGRKTAYRLLDGQGRAVDEVLGHPMRTDALPGPGARPLQQALVRAGKVVNPLELTAARAHHLVARAELSAEALTLSDGPPALVARDLHEAHDPAVPPEPSGNQRSE